MTAEWKTWHKWESIGRDGVAGIEIRVKTARGATEADRHALCKAAHALEAAFDDETARLDPKTAEAVEVLRNNISGSFIAAGFEPIYLETIPNEYTNSSERLLSPWFLVTTKAGHFKVGWRRHVIVLDWSRTTIAQTAATLFPAEDVTKGDRDIHCWGYGKLIEYLKVLHAEVK